MDELIRKIDEALRGGERIAISTIVQRHGSLPMGRRARFVVRQDGSALGTIGGGCLEAEVYARAQELLRDGGAHVDTFNLTEIEEGLQGHICGGSVSILTAALLPEPSTVRLFERLHRDAIARRSQVLASRLPSADGVADSQAPDHVLVNSGGDVLVAPAGSVVGDFIGRCLEVLAKGEPRIVEMNAGSCCERYLAEPLVPRPSAVVFGAGHCGQAIGRLASVAGFRVLMLDDRAHFLSPDQMPFADVIEQIDFDAALESVEVGADPYFVIVTRGHDHDLTLLRQLLPHPSSYLGMIGSKRKRILFERTLTHEGVPAAQLARLRSPMGLPIGAETPEEIAVAVVGEMVAVRRGSEPVLQASPRRRRTS